jgi:alanine-synthesizing transaminase
VTAVPYALEYHGSWRIDIDSVARAATDKVKAILVVSPNNPTGSFLHRDDLTAISGLAAANEWAIIGDEVFADYSLDAAPDAAAVLPGADVLTFSLGGLSKSSGLPQLKLGWIGIGGPTATVDRAMAAYEIIADTYLSVSTAVQAAAPELIEHGAAIRQQILARVRRNLDALRTAAAKYPAIDVLRVEGGWSAVLQVPQLRSEESLVLDLLEHDDVLVHPGYFFDFPREAYVVVSLLVEPPAFDTAIARLLKRASS